MRRKLCVPHGIDASANKMLCGTQSELLLRYPTTGLCQLQMHFDSYKIDLKHSMAEHSRKMSLMIRDLSTVPYVITEEQQIQAVLQLPPQSWDTILYGFFPDKKGVAFPTAIDKIVKNLSIKTRESHWIYVKNTPD